ncbi:GNAT family N-acetyltransferase [Clostridium tyrobutyricum]|uniref:GNAT family N-acetyltransferase n=1 Tax=Clostridium tyrobutyricum TaxID=1519 RepID=UPI001C38E87F|nr:GNAT family N-acetyltransferase [Clostridium tyrobutyricum]MBV4419270.1 GNAT family N-acetyltransferase [Clostridium tyrobutyricum]
MIRHAVKNDVKNIIKIIDKIIVEMDSYENNQWDKSYPRETDFLKDINAKNLFICERNGKIAGFICVDRLQVDEYTDVEWSLKENFMVIHRMAVNPECRRMGIGSELLDFAEEYALENNIRYLKTDTYSINVKMNNLFKKFGYDIAGQIKIPEREKPFNCYEKILDEEVFQKNMDFCREA